MRRATVWGGFVGFALATCAGFFAGREPVMLLLEGCLACLVGAWLLRWLHGIVVRNVHESLEVRRQEAAAAGAGTGAGRTHTTKG